MAAPVPLVRVMRSGAEEAVHTGSIVVAEADGTPVAWAGDPDRFTFARSSMKPLQAAVSLSLLLADELTDREIAVMCASHNGELVHVEVVRRILGRAGLGPEALRCPEVLPGDIDAALEAGRQDRVFSDCSGKHAGMLLACVARGWDTASYPDPDHPLQRLVLEAVAAGTGPGDVAVGVDGCGVPVHGVSVARMATLYARLALPVAFDGLTHYVRRAVEAMRAEPYFVAGRNRVCTDLMQTVPGVIAKVGAEGLLCAAVLDRGWGIAVKIEDGAHRASAPVLLRVLEALGVFDEVPEGLRRWTEPPVLGGGHPVGALVADFELDRA